MIDELATIVDHFIVTDAPTAPAARAWPITDALTYATTRGLSAVAVSDFAHALRLGEDIVGTVVVTGSFHTVGDAMDRLQVSPFTG